MDIRMVKSFSRIKRHDKTCENSDEILQIDSHQSLEHKSVLEEKPVSKTSQTSKQIEDQNSEAAEIQAFRVAKFSQDDAVIA